MDVFFTEIYWEIEVSSSSVIVRLQSFEEGEYVTSITIIDYCVLQL